MTVHERTSTAVALALAASYLMVVAGAKKKLLHGRSPWAPMPRPLVRRLSTLFGRRARSGFRPRLPRRF